MSDAPAAPTTDEPVKLFGDPHVGHVVRGPDRRSGDANHASTSAGAPATGRSAEQWAARFEADHLAGHRGDAVRALRIGGGDTVATLLHVGGFLLLGLTLVMSGIIFSNAKNVGAFSDPWNSNRVAIGFAVLAVGLIDSAILIGLARVISFQLATLRLTLRAHEPGSAG